VLGSPHHPPIVWPEQDGWKSTASVSLPDSSTLPTTGEWPRYAREKTTRCDNRQGYFRFACLSFCRWPEYFAGKRWDKSSTVKAMLASSGAPRGSSEVLIKSTPDSPGINWIQSCGRRHMSRRPGAKAPTPSQPSDQNTSNSPFPPPGPLSSSVVRAVYPMQVSHLLRYGSSHSRTVKVNQKKKKKGISPRGFPALRMSHTLDPGRVKHTDYFRTFSLLSDMCPIVPYFRGAGAGDENIAWPQKTTAGNDDGRAQTRKRGWTTIWLCGSCPTPTRRLTGSLNMVARGSLCMPSPSSIVAPAVPIGKVSGMLPHAGVHDHLASASSKMEVPQGKTPDSERQTYRPSQRHDVVRIVSDMYADA